MIADAIQDTVEKQLSLKNPTESEKTIKLDGEDSVRLENLLLRQHVENLTQELESSRKEKAQRMLLESRVGYENHLYKKHSINKVTHKITVDAATYTLSVTPHDKVESDN